jgi:predicted nucleic acid-binding protein
MRYAIDAATLVALAQDQRPMADHRLVAPNSLRTRALELVLSQVRAGTLAEQDVRAMHDRITEIPVRLLGDRVSRGRAWRLAREADWPDLQDAELLAVAILQADALVTADPELISKAAGLVPVATFDALFVPDPT